MPDPTGGITVSGEGVVRAAPDRADLALGVSVQRARSEEARRDAAAAVEAMLAALRSAGVEQRDIQTRRLSITPEYDYEKGKQRPRGYRARNALSVIVRDIDRVGEIVDAALAAAGDAAIMEGLDLDIHDREGLQAQALVAAMSDARRKAEVLAEVAGARLGAVTRIVEGREGWQPEPRFAMFTAQAELRAETPVVPGEVSVQASVTVTWAIDPGSD